MHLLESLMKGSIYRLSAVMVTTITCLRCSLQALIGFDDFLFLKFRPSCNYLINLTRSVSCWRSIVTVGAVQVIVTNSCQCCLSSTRHLDSRWYKSFRGGPRFLLQWRWKASTRRLPVTWRRNNVLLAFRDDEFVMRLQATWSAAVHLKVWFKPASEQKYL